MNRFMDENFLLSSKTARTLYHDHAASLPIIDYHCHVSPCEIAEDVKAENISQLWLHGDHYKWRLMRACGIEEESITGSAGDKTKFLRFAEAIAKAPGNPVYHWAHLELQRYFGYHGALSPATAEEVWALTSEKLKDLSVREIIRRSNVEVIVTTDDPIDTLEWHRQIPFDESFPVRVLPGWRPDRALHIFKPDFTEYITALIKASQQSIASVSDLKSALVQRMDFFAENGCVISDHGLESVPFAPASDSEIEEIFTRRLQGEMPDAADVLRFQHALLLFLGQEYARRGWVMQIHYGVMRNVNTRQFAKLGADTGFDCIGMGGGAASIAAFLDDLEQSEQLPKTILYSLNPNDDAMLDTIAGCFQAEGIAGKVQHGSAWWFNDSKAGMIRHLEGLANQSVLGNFIGMLTDSRSFLSYTRHEYFRRILCDLLGTWAENGEYPADLEALGEIVRRISYENAKAFFPFPSK